MQDKVEVSEGHHSPSKWIAANNVDTNNLDVAKAPDPFDPSKLRLSQDFAASIGVTKQITTVPVRRPSKETWIQIHPDKSYQIQTCVLELKEDQEIYLVAPEIWPDLAGESTIGPRALFTAMTRQGVLFLWPVRLPGSDGRLDSWNRSALEASSMAVGNWVRISANKPLGAYDVFRTKADLPPPEWPKVSFNEILKIAFKDKYIDSLDHPVLKQLRGEI